MSDTTTSLQRPAPWFTNEGEAMLAGFLAGYSGLTGEACALDPVSSRSGATITSRSIAAWASVG